jgi:hypothetical protein
MLPKIETRLSRLFEARKRAILAEGYRGAEVYRRLAVDPELPTEVGTEDAAAILGVQPETLKTRRRKRMPPTYTRRFGDKSLTYDLAVLCDLLAAGTVEAA